jgi:Fe-S cluster biogenesis protein NfuA
MAAVEVPVVDSTEEMLGEVLDLHGEGVARLWAALDDAARARLVDDPVVCSMLLVHGLHPVPLEDRVRAALASVRPYLDSHGGDVELLGLDDGVAHLLLKGSCNGCASSSATLELAIESALDEHAPDLDGVEVEGLPDTVRTPGQPGKTLPMVSSRPSAPAAGAWLELKTTPAPGGLLRAGQDLLVANVAGTLLAYRDACAGCGASLLGGTMDDGALQCPVCSRRFSLPLAGRALGPEDIQLEPVPLLEDGGRVRVAA